MNFNALRQRPWRNNVAKQWWNLWPKAKALPVLYSPPTMLSHYECRMLYWVAKNMEGDGALLDMGTFLGGSTAFFAQGILARGDGKRIHINSYDLYRLGDFEREHWFTNKGVPVPKDDNFLPLYEANIKQFRDLVTIHEGDVCLKRWNGSPIEVMFIDLAKISKVNDHLLEEFFPALNENSLLIQQDYLWPFTPWLPVSMLMLQDCFERIVDEPASVLYRCKRTPSKAEIEAACWKNISVTDRRSLLSKAIANEVDPKMSKRLTENFTNGSLDW